MESLRVGIVGFGAVGQGLVKILSEQGGDRVNDGHTVIKVIWICDRSKGCLVDRNGLALPTLLAAMRDATYTSENGWQTGITMEQLLPQYPIDVLIELSDTNLNNGEPACSHIRLALNHGIHVITTNKGPVVLHYDELKALAEANNAFFGVEGTVMSGTPALRFGWQNLTKAGISKIEGILNGTSNYMLKLMEEGESYEAALQQAQNAGYAEADPSNDVLGYDTAAKLAILASVLNGKKIALSDIPCAGITQLHPDEIKHANEAGQHWKLVGTLEKQGDRWQAFVKPQKLSADHMLASVQNNRNGLIFQTDLLGEIFITGPGAGGRETGYAVIQDLQYLAANAR